MLDHASYIVGAGADTRVALGALLEVLLIIANIGSAVVLFPILKRLLAIVTLRQDVGGAGGGASLVTVGRSLVAVHDWTFLLGPGWVVGVGNGLILGCLMYRSGLVPRRMAMLGLIGGPLIIASGTAVLFNVIEPGSAPQFIATIPDFAWELSLGIYLTVKGFKPSPILSATIGDAGAGERFPALAAAER